MKIKEIKERINLIKTASDEEAAHSMEDWLYRDFVTYIATLRKNPLGIKAREIMKTKKINFSRWCA